MRVRLCVRAAILAVGLACAAIDEAAAATITAVQSAVASADTGGTSLAKAFSSSTAAGNLLVVVVGFNSSYIIDFLKSLGNEGEVRLEFKDSQSAGQIRPEDPEAEYKSRYVLMPMRVSV